MASGAAIVRDDQTQVLYAWVGTKALKRDGSDGKLFEVCLALRAMSGAIWSLSLALGTGLHVSTSAGIFDLKDDLTQKSGYRVRIS